MPLGKEYDERVKAIPAVNRITFNPVFVRDIIEGNKTQTRRLKRKSFKAGTLLFIRTPNRLYTNSYMKRVDSPAILRVTKLDESEYPSVHRFGDMTDAWAVKDGFENKVAFWDTMRRCYPDETITDDTLLYMKSFEVVDINPRTWGVPV